MALLSDVLRGRFSRGRDRRGAGDAGQAIRPLAAALVLTLSACAAPAPPPAPSAASTDIERLRAAGAEVLFWDQPTRDRNFPRMERLFPSREIAGSPTPRPLPGGAPLPAAAVALVDAHVAVSNVAGLLVLQDGRVRHERYARGLTRQGRWTSFSVAKSLTSTLVGAAIADGSIRSLDDPVTRYIPELAGGGYDGVTVRQLLTMTSGVRWNEDYADPESDVARMLVAPVAEGADQTVAYMRGLPRARTPGDYWRYSTGETNLVGVLVRRATGKGLADYAAEKIWRPYGMEAPLAWQTGLDGAEIGGCCFSVALRDYGRLGQFVLDDGVANGRRVVPEGWFAAATRQQAATGAPGRGYGYQWWTDADGSFSAAGIFGQTVLVDPERRLVVVILSAWPKATDPALGRERRAFLDALRTALD